MCIEINTSGKNYLHKERVSLFMQPINDINYFFGSKLFGIKEIDCNKLDIVPFFVRGVGYKKTISKVGITLEHITTSQIIRFYKQDIHIFNSTGKSMLKRFPEANFIVTYLGIHIQSLLTNTLDNFIFSEIKLPVIKQENSDSTFISKGYPELSMQIPVGFTENDFILRSNSPEAYKKIININVEKILIPNPKILSNMITFNLNQAKNNRLIFMDRFTLSYNNIRDKQVFKNKKKLFVKTYSKIYNAIKRNIISENKINDNTIQKS